MMQCYPCIRGCAYMKVVLAVALLLLALWILADTPIVLDCSEVRTTCPAKFDRLLNDLSQGRGEEVSEAVIDDYCRCLEECINYMGVFRLDGQSEKPTNCYRKSVAAGIQSSTVAGQYFSLEKGRSLVPGLAEAECQSCGLVSGHQNSLFSAMALLATACGVVLFVSAGCEHLEVKHHAVPFTAIGMSSDMVCASALSLAFVLSVVGGRYANGACNPEHFNKLLVEAARASTWDDANHAARYSKFFNDIFDQSLHRMCAEESTFQAFACVAFMGVVSALWSCVASGCICVGIANDAEESDSEFDNLTHQELDNVLKSHGHLFTGPRVTGR